MLSLLALLALVPAAYAQFPPTPKDVTELQSKYHEGVRISYKEPGICETTPGVKSYSGYVHLPPGLLSDINGESQDYPINTLLPYAMARKDPTNAPLTIWLNGGPGGSSMMGLLQENGPCFVGADSNSTYLNPWSWNNEVNVLYLDQPTQVGFSYDVPTNVTWNVAQIDAEQHGPEPADFSKGVPEQNNTFWVGTTGSQTVNHTANSTTHAAHALWHFAQTWFSEFPAYKPNDDRISLWTESYGGHYGPGFFKFFQEQNEKINNGSITEDGTHYLHLDTLGIVNGLLDAVLQVPAYAEMAYNNTYGLKLISEDVYNKAMDSFYKPGGCKEKLLVCQRKATQGDADWRGDKPEVIKCFEDLQGTCSSVADASLAIEWGWYDIAHPITDPTPEPYIYGFLRQHWVLEALGVPVNYTAAAPAVSRAFESTSDIERAGSMEAVAYLLDSGVKVHMMYGDRDYACNWLGGEAASLGIEYSNTGNFQNAGYAPILGVEGTGGLTRQYGNFSFSRVFQAGHEVPWYQPEVSYNIFMRAMFNKDIATGLLDVTDDLATVGPRSTFHVKNEVPPAPEPLCYVLSPGTCTPKELKSILDGTAIVKDWILVGNTNDGKKHGLNVDGTQTVLEAEYVEL